MTKTITFDLETWSQNMLGMTSGGIHPGQMTLYYSARGAGKSTFNQMFRHMSGTDSIFKMQNELKSKYNFSRKWYVADFNYKDYDEVREWCTHHFGKEDKYPNAWSRWQHRYELQIFFRDSKDYEWFKLRWS